MLRFSDGRVEELGGSEAQTTNNRMELSACLALLERLQQLPRAEGLAIRTDSKYLIDGFTRWINGWKRKGWRTASGSAVLNRDLWEALDAARLPDVALAHVKGHSGDPDNERCDAIAVAHSHGQIPAENKASPEEPADLAPASLRDLLTRLEVADRLASGGYGLTLVELAQLVEQPVRQLEERKETWIWRDWLVEPLQGQRWRLQRREAGSGEP